MRSSDQNSVKNPARHQVWRMFDRIAHRYDLLNRLLSGGRDVAWRKRICKALPDLAPISVLDLATGTADVLLAMQARRPGTLSGVGLDMSLGMLLHGQRKIADRGLEQSLQLIRGDATCLPVPDKSFDAVSIAFGIRNVVDVPLGLREMRRALRPGGRALILEFGLPANPLFCALYLFYFRHVLPRVGGLLSGDSAAYRYLNRTVETFPYGAAFEALLWDAGFSNVHTIPLTFGIAALYVGERPAEDRES